MKTRTTVVLSGVLIGLGLVLIVETVVVGGAIGYVLGVLFVAAGAGRIYLSQSSRKLRGEP